MKKTKAGIKTRVFLSFGFFVLIIINLFVFALYNLISSAYIKSLSKTIEANQQKIVNTIKDKQSSDYLLNIDQNLSQEIEADGMFFYIFLKNKEVDSTYKLGTYLYDDKIISRKDVGGFNVIVGKQIPEIQTFKRSIIDQIIFINIFSILLVFAMSYFMADRILKPLLKLAKRLGNYDIENETELLENNFGDSEIGVITDAVNTFIGKSRTIYQEQRRFIQDSSHELKTPLMQIDSNIELIEEKIENPKILARLENIKRSTANISTIVSNLSFIMRGQEGVESFEKIDMQKYFKTLLASYQDLADEKNIDLKLEVKKNFFLKNASYYLDRLFGNLLQNAIFYNEGKGVVEVVIEKGKITVRDEGIGMETSELEKIFSRFYRNSDSSSYNANGSGLGLTIVKKICSDFGWKLEAKSKLGVGTSFTVHIC